MCRTIDGVVQRMSPSVEPNLVAVKFHQVAESPDRRPGPAPKFVVGVTVEKGIEPVYFT